MGFFDRKPRESYEASRYKALRNTRIRRIFITEHDINCWYYCIECYDDSKSIRFSAGSQDDAYAKALVAQAEIEKLLGIRLEIHVRA